jgi:hypothetical protein
LTLLTLLGCLLISCLSSCPVGLQDGAAVLLSFGVGWALSLALSHHLSSPCSRHAATRRDPNSTRAANGSGRMDEPLASAASLTGALSWCAPRHRCGRCLSTSVVAALASLGLLERRQLRRASHMHAASLGPSSAFTSPSSDQFPLKFGQAAQHRQHEPAVRCRRICPSIG